MASRTVQSVDRAVELLRALAGADGPVTLAALAGACDLERPTAWRLLWTLQTHGLVERVGSGYRIGHGVLGLSGASALDSLARVARPVLEGLSAEHGATASLAYVERFRVVYLDHVDSPLFSSPGWEGRAVSLHASSPGKAVLAALPPGEVAGMTGPTLERLTDTTITDVGELTSELERVRAQGYAVCRGEDVTYSNGASAVVALDGRPVAVIDLWGPERMVPISRLPELGAAAVDGAARLRRLLAPDTA